MSSCPRACTCRGNSSSGSACCSSASAVPAACPRGRRSAIPLAWAPPEPSSAPGRLPPVVSLLRMTAIIEALDARKTYRVGKIEVPALRGVTLSVEKGRFVSVVGPSGSGKSTLFYLLGGLTRADSGRIMIDGDDFSQLSDAERTRMRKRKIGFVFQKFNLLPTRAARANIEIPRDIAGNDTFDPAHFTRICDLLGLSQRLAHRPS